MKFPHAFLFATLCLPVVLAGPLTAAETVPPSATLVVRADQPGAIIDRNIYGQFAEHLGHGIYEGVWVGENSPIPNTRGIRNDVVTALKNLKVPVVRWPGGCFADEYHWKDGIGPRAKRPSMINTHWGGVVEDNSFGTHEFLDFCEMIGSEPYVCGNVGSGTVQEMMEWVEYLTSDASSPMANLRRANGREKPWRIKYFGVGNENWGCGGNMTPQYYSDQFRRFNTFVKNYDRENPLQRIACGASNSDYGWTETVMKQVGKRMHGLSLHYYTVPRTWKAKGPATGFDEAAWHQTLAKTLVMDDLIRGHSAIMDATDPEKRVALVVDEWGTWYAPEPGTNPGFLYQQNTLRDALVAALNLNIFHKYCDRVRMANIAQMVNVLQAMILTDKEKMVLTPTYHVFEMFNVNQGATLLPSELTTPDYVLGKDKMPALSASASRDSTGRIHLSLANADATRTIRLQTSLTGITPTKVTGRILTAPEIGAHNTFADPTRVRPAPFDGATVSGSQVTIEMPPRSVVVLNLETAASAKKARTAQ